jgi:hypothetical protein
VSETAPFLPYCHFVISVLPTWLMTKREEEIIIPSTASTPIVHFIAPPQPSQQLGTQYRVWADYKRRANGEDGTAKQNMIAGNGCQLNFYSARKALIG